MRLNRILTKTYLETTVDGTIVRHQIPFLVSIEIHLGKQVNGQGSQSINKSIKSLVSKETVVPLRWSQTREIAVKRVARRQITTAKISKLTF